MKGNSAVGGAKHSRRARIFRRIVGVSFLFTLAAVIALVAVGIAVYSSQELSTRKLENHTKNLLVYDNSGALIDDAGDFRYTALSDLADHTLWAFIAVEDKNFYHHNGISPLRIAKALINNIKSGYTKEGASTISQQLIKNTHLTHEKTLQRKIREAALAHKLERAYTKEQILEMYLNVVYFGNGIYGLQNAANYYFSKDASALSVREAASLAGVLRSPARYCPIQHYDNFIARGNLVLWLMHEQSHLTDSEYAAAKLAPLTVNLRQTTSHGSSYKTAVAAEAARLLNLSQGDLASFGYKIYTYYEPSVQAGIHRAVTAPDFRIENLSGAAADRCVISATPDGRIQGYYASTPTLHDAKRNFGSSLKPLAVYAPALELGIVSSATVITDEEFAAGEFHPRNFDGTFHGPVSVREAIAQSYNIPAVKVLDYTRLDRAAMVARRLGLNLADENLSLALGNTANGTAFSELLAGYCTVANGGLRARPAFIKKIISREGRTVYEGEPTLETRAIGEDTAFLLTDMLRTAVLAGTGSKLASLPYDIAAKTGTTEREGGSSNTDAVNVSFTRDNVVLVWYGNADMKAENDLPKGVGGGGITSFVAREVQREINNAPEDFRAPTSVQSLEIDTLDAATGLLTLANDAVPSEHRRKEFFALRYRPTLESNNFVRPEAILLDGEIGDTGAPMVHFETSPFQVYEIYKTIDAGEVLLEVISDRTGPYVYFDTHAAAGTEVSYHIETYLKGADDTLAENRVQSNRVKLFLSGEVRRDSSAIVKKKTRSGKSWYF